MRDPREVIQRVREAVSLGRQVFTTLEAGGDIFKKAVATILSQNTNDQNSIEAFRRLDEKVDVTPNNMLQAREEDIIEAIKIAGLYKQKLESIKELARRTVEELGGDLSRLKDWDTEEARKWLLSIKGVGKKTADIILLHLGHPTFPVDTHISRVTCRLGLTSSRRYDEVSSVWRNALEPREYLDAHLHLIAFGREICISRKPRCEVCPLKQFCRYYSEDGEDCKA